MTTELIVAAVGALLLFLFGRAKGKQGEKKRRWKQDMKEHTEQHEVQGEEFSSQEAISEAVLETTKRKLKELENAEPAPITDLDDAIARFNTSLSDEPGDSS